MTEIITGRDKVFARWASTRIPFIDRLENLGTFHAVGLATGRQSTDRLMAVVMFHHINPRTRVCQVAMAAVDPHWSSRRVFHEVLSIPFHDLGCHRVWAIIPHKDERAIRLLSLAGFVKEGDLKNQFGRRVHGRCFRMMRTEFDRTYGEKTPFLGKLSSFDGQAMGAIQ